jgi:hypothetical protein
MESLTLAISTTKRLSVLPCAGRHQATRGSLVDIFAWKAFGSAVKA